MNPFIPAVLLSLPITVTFAGAIAEETKTFSKQAGFFDVYHDAGAARVLLRVAQFEQPFLMNTSLPYGLGSNDVGLDRGQIGDVRMVEFRRYGKKIMLVQRNTRYVANSADSAERQSVTEAFAESVLWSGDIVAQDADNSVLIDFSSFVTADRHGIASRLDNSKQGSYSVDDKRSAVLLPHCKSFPRNTEFEALLTFGGGNNGNFVEQVAMDSKSLTMRQHISFVKLPEAGFVPRAYHPFSGGIDVGLTDFATPLAQSLDVRFQARCRLQKDSQGKTINPIVFYLDRGTPEPVRSALLDGANWWQTAFAKAGFADGYRVELMPADIDPMDVRYNTIQWVHRATRGWSYGSFIADPRNGEIIKGAVTLGSQRVRQDILIAESLLAPYGKNNEAELKQQAEHMALARLRQLSAHEVGHTLGFAHNFATSRVGNGSVMDYPHPILTVGNNHQLSLQNAYGVGVGEWDDYVVQHAYGVYAPEQESTALQALRRSVQQKGLLYSSDPDARSANSAHPDGLLWDFGANTLDTFDLIMRARQQALNQFSLSVLPPQRQLGEIEARFVPVYLLHRYQTEAVARLLGGASYAYGVACDNITGTQTVAHEKQQQALQRLVKNLQVETLTIPNNVFAVMTPPANSYERNREYFTTQMAPLFDALAAIEAASAQTAQLLFEPARLNRVAWQSLHDPKQLTLANLLQSVFNGTWRHAKSVENQAASATIQLTANWVVLDALLNSLDSGRLHPVVEAEVRAQLQNWRTDLIKMATGSQQHQFREAAKYIDAYFADSKNLKRRSNPVIPPGAPI